MKLTQWGRFQTCEGAGLTRHNLEVNLSQHPNAANFSERIEFPNGLYLAQGFIECVFGTSKLVAAGFANDGIDRGTKVRVSVKNYSYCDTQQMPIDANCLPWEKVMEKFGLVRP